ncbi:UbiX family flavin prenyltransferase [bacterium]|nr:UbiX family flavin prenyltransferase [bacterium]MBU0899554.1 UbiX family flavin prenyltransferase [bacterium]MBU1153535.1 UbiX family flavin prenyltransferase [bacterium]MBU1782276.1 UbiX family flavin prenyltransferase [bacterium]MBU2600108.1 UbiX family flavin prenyltransferase [bacterium]
MRYIVGISGASGVIYGERLVKCLLEMKQEVFLMITDTAKEIFKHELNIEAGTYFKENEILHYLDYRDLFSPIASGSFKTEGMIVIPCSMGTLAAIANGSSDNLIERAADVTLKERRQLILVPRETPLNEIHLQNMLTLRKMGADIVAAMPPFYHKPQTIDDLVEAVVRKVTSLLGLKTTEEWKGRGQ